MFNSINQARQRALRKSVNGEVATNLVQIYHALAGGWAIRDNPDPSHLLLAAMKEHKKEVSVA